MKGHIYRSNCRRQISRAKSGRSFFSGSPVQAKLSINEPGDRYEQEADSIANKIVHASPSKTSSTFFPPVQTGFIQKKETNAGSQAVTPSVVEALNTTGRPMDKGTRSFMEQRFGHDFSNVQIHDDSVAHQSSSEVNALAYTQGKHIVFGEGQYQPDTNSGKQLLAHELVHVMQQSDMIRRYRKKNEFNFGRSDTPTLIEDSFSWPKDKQTKPWIELITVELTGKTPDREGKPTWFGVANAKYYDNPVKWPDFSFTVMAGSDALGNTTAGTNYKVERLEGDGYNSGKYSTVEKSNREGPLNRYSKDLSANMNFAVFFSSSEALHHGDLDLSSHGCVHVDYAQIQQLNYHSVRYKTKIIIKYPKP